MSRKLLAIAFSVLCFSVGTLAYEANPRYVDSILDLTGACRPQGVKLSAISTPGLSEPDYQGTPAYGAIPLNGDAFHLVLDRGAEGSVLYVDTDRSGVLRKVDWERQLWDGSFLASVPFSVSYDGLQTPSIYRVFLIWSPLTPTVLTYCRASYLSGEIQLGDVTYLIALIDDNTDGRYDDLDRDIMFIDTDQDGELFTTIRFVETARNNKLKKILEKEYTIAGDIIHFDALIVKFGNKMVMDGKTRALYLWRRVYGEKMTPAEGFSIEEPGAEPQRYKDMLEALPIEQKKLFWSEIWELANDTEKLAEYDISAIYGNAVYWKLREGLIYIFKINSTGQVYPEIVPDI